VRKEWRYVLPEERKNRPARAESQLTEHNSGKGILIGLSGRGGEILVAEGSGGRAGGQEMRLGNFEIRA